MDTHNITAVFNQGMSFTSHINGHKVVTDSNSEGAGDGSSPKRLMLASLAGCTGIDVVSFLAEAAILPSKGEARKLVLGGGMSINRKKVDNVQLAIDNTLLLHEKYILVQKGKKVLT